MKHNKHIIANLLSPLVKEEASSLVAQVQTPPQSDHGDHAFACFAYAKKYKKAPDALAKMWAEALLDKPLPDEIERIEVKGGYLNFFLNPTLFAKNLLTLLYQNPEAFGRIEQASPKTMVIEFSSPNIAKPFSIGHLRSTNLGAILSRVASFCGHNVIKLNHLGDWGTQFGKLITAYRKWGNAQMLDEKPIEALFDLYVKFHEEEENDPSLVTQAREAFSALEKGDEQTKELWDWFRNLTLKELDGLYTKLGVEFDHIWGESFYIDQLPSILSTLSKKGITEHSEGALIVDLKKQSKGVAVLQKGDESSLYITRDLAAAIYRQQTFDFDSMLYVVGNEQKLHFEQLFCILEMAGYSFADRLKHVPFGQINFGDEKMSTRKGNVVFLQDVLDRAQEKASQIVQAKNPDLEHIEEVSQDVALGAILFADISAKRIKNIKFHWEDILNFEGETGPYLQYTYVRTQSLMRKYGQEVRMIEDFGHLQSSQEMDLLRCLSELDDAVIKVMSEHEPFYLGQYALKVAKTFNRFYQACRILDAQKEVQESRMLLVFATSVVLEQTMTLLGLPNPKEM